MEGTGTERTSLNSRKEDVEHEEKVHMPDCVSYLLKAGARDDSSLDRSPLPDTSQTPETVFCAV